MRGGYKEKEGKATEEKRGTVLILWPLSQTSSLPPSRPTSLPPSLPAANPPAPTHPCFSFFPPVLPGIKTSIHAPEDTHSRGERKRDEEGGEGGGGCQGGTVLRITAIRPKAQNCVLFLWVFFFLHMPCTALAYASPPPDLVASAAPSVSSERVGGKVWKLGFIQHFHSRINALTLHLQVELRMYSSARKRPIICAQSLF